jgi:hypothetical protein
VVEVGRPSRREARDHSARPCVELG